MQQDMPKQPGLREQYAAFASWLAGAGQRLAVTLTRAYEERRLLDMRDAHMEQQELAERFRSGNWQ